MYGIGFFEMAVNAVKLNCQNNLNKKYRYGGSRVPDFKILDKQYHCKHHGVDISTDPQANEVEQTLASLEAP